MPRTYAVISSVRELPGKPARQTIVERDLDAKAAARAAVRVARDVKDSAWVVPMGSHIENVQMMCSVTLKTRRAGARATRYHVLCVPMPTFKRLLKASKNRRTRRR